ncbi:membrane bound O-acyl transferase family-domain-containing protein [Cytidiella melzeri]|nr:membrane bound O-acyl transferase family-domain-containing protein [Cytidiella melzeri]
MNQTTRFVESLVRPERLPLSNAKFVVLPILALSVGVSLRPSKPVRVGGLVCYVFWSFNGTKFTAGGGYEDYLKGCFLGATSLLAFYDLVLTDPMTEWRHNSQPTLRPADLPLWKRVYWVLCEAANNRGIGWSSQVPYIPPLPSYDRRSFLARRTRQLLWNLLLVDIAQTYERINPVFAPGSTRGMWSQGTTLGYINLLARITVAWGMFNIPYCWLSLACVATGIHEPRDWPDTFGKWSDAYTVRRFWSRSWHQRLRRYTATTGRSAARFLRCKPGTWLSARVQLIFGFGISTLVHLLGDLMVDTRWAGASAPFFLWQIVAITFEDFVVGVGSHFGVEEGLWTHAIGWLWTFAWFNVTATRFIDWTFPAGAAMHETFQYSAVRPIIDYVGRAIYGVDLASYLSSAISEAK